MRYTVLTSRGKAIFTLPTLNSQLKFSTLFQKPQPFVSYSIIFRRESCSSQSALSLSPSRAVSFLQRNPGFAVCKGISISSSASNVIDWNDAVSFSRIGARVGLEEEEDVIEDFKACISVRAFFFSTSVDLRSLVNKNKQNFIPPSSRMTNYVVLRFGDLQSDPHDLSSSLGGNDCCYMVVFQYGSIVLFNVGELEVDGYLKIVEGHSSGLLPEMRKDDRISRGRMPSMPRSGSTSAMNLN